MNEPTPPAVDAVDAVDTVDVAAHLRASISALVRAARTSDRLARIPSAVLDLLEKRGPMTTADLAAGRGVRHQTMTATVKELADAGYLEAAPDPDDGRKKLLVLTEQGKAALEADRNQRVGVLADAMQAALNEDERRAVADALVLIDRITASLVAAGN